MKESEIVEYETIISERRKVESNKLKKYERLYKIRSFIQKPKNKWLGLKVVCPKCSNELEVDTDRHRYSLYYKCNKCDYEYVELSF